MKRKILIVFLITVIAFSCSCFAFADDTETPAPDPEESDYVEASLINPLLFVSNGDAVCKTTVQLKGGSSANKMVATVKYIKQGVGVVSTKTATAYKSGSSITATTRMDLTSSGSYHCKVTVQLYNGSTLLESVNVLTNTISY